MAEAVPIQANGAANESAGVRQSHTGFKPPKPQPGMLNKEMAEAAAKKYNKDKKKIQKACAKVDSCPNAEATRTCSCTIM
jgi:hypothetical protein